jgi:murein DD-endopeptidase MepM/ murein hydrolase activator NlpD
MEENGKLSYWAVLFKANSFADMLDRMEMVREIAAADEKCLEDLQKAAKEVSDSKEEMTQMLTDLQSRRGELTVLEAELDEKRAETDRLLQDLRARGAEFEEMIEQSELMQEELMEEIANKKDEYEDQKYKEWLSTSKPSGGSGYSPESNATWVQPCKFTYISSPFGMRYHPISGAYKMHNGIDIPGASGTPIYATRSGYVSVAAYQAGGAGNYVSLNHGDGFGSIYMHMTHYIVSVGQYVSAGQVIGYMGTTGGSTGVHLHFGIFYNGTYVNPCNYVNFR